MAGRPALRALADHVGILGAYVSADGRERRPTSDATRVALLAALGHDASDEAAAARALAAREEEERGRRVQPVQIVAPGPSTLHVDLAASRGSGLPYDLEVRTEGGEVHERGGRVRVPTSGILRIRLPALPLGVHHVRLVLGETEVEQVRIAAPRRCVTPDERLGRRRVAGLWTNLYTVRSDRGLGIGDFGDLRAVVRLAGRGGAAFVGLNPLFALRNRRLEASPYSPVSRLFRNPLYLALDSVPELGDSPEAARRLGSPAARRRIEALRRRERVDYEGAAAVQRPVLEALYRAFSRLHERGDTARGRAYAAFRARGGDLLVDFATFLALEDHLSARGVPRDWRTWPGELRSPGSPAVREFRSRHPDEVGLHMYVQFELDRQLASAAREARRAGLSVGLYQDLPIGSAASGFDTWAFPGLFVDGASLGCPPDVHIPTGQDWALPPIDPHRLRADGYRYWRLVLESVFAHSGLVRLDHAMGLYRKFWIPRGAPPSQGAYVRSPARALLALLALESRRSGALVVGEDLGTVPRGLPAALSRAGVLSSRILLFERDPRGAFRPARSYSRRALVTANTHDLPTLAGFWTGRDLEVQREIGLLPDDESLRRARIRRERDRRALTRRLVREGLLRSAEATPSYPEICAAVHTFLCRTPAPLVGVALDDLAAETEPVNVPGVPPERYPSWTRKMRRTIGELARDVQLRRLLAGLTRRGRGRS